MDLTPTEHRHDVDVEAAKWPTRALRIAFMAMAVVLVCISIISVLIAIEASRTQVNADEQRRANEELRQELQCRAAPVLVYDRESSKLDAMIAEGLANIASGEFNDPDAFAEEIRTQVTTVNESLDKREAAITVCSSTDVP